MLGRGARLSLILAVLGSMATFSSDPAPQPETDAGAVRRAIPRAPITPFLTGPASEAPAPPVWRPGDPLRVVPMRMADPAAIRVPRDRPAVPDALAGRSPVGPRGAAVLTSPTRNFPGSVSSAVPPDTNGDVGPDHYVQAVNFFNAANGASGSQITVYNKARPIPNQLLQFQLGTLPNQNPACSQGFGDPVVVYDRAADRWVLIEFSTMANNLLCIYVSTGPDPRGAYFNYSIATATFPDYPKLAVWPTDANGGQGSYVITTNEIGGNPPVVGLYAMNRGQMLVGAQAGLQQFTLPRLSGFAFWSATPADVDGARTPPPATPAIVMYHRDTEAHLGPDPAGVDLLDMWSLQVDWNQAANSALAQLPGIQTAEFDSSICSLTTFNCIPQPGTGQLLNPSGMVLMHPLQYMNRGTHESLVGSFTVDSGNEVSGIRWFELRRTGGGGWNLRQEGTYSTTDEHRFLGSVAAGSSGTLALGYNVSSGNTFPGIRYTATAGSNGQMSEPETTVISGLSSQPGSNRFGDYSAMQLDPLDDCTFWFTAEYMATNSWATQIVSMRDNTGGDIDLDGIADHCDDCPVRFDPGQDDDDLDRAGDACDNCRNLANADQQDSDADGLGDACDNCPFAADPDQTDSDGDGSGDVCDVDDDNDGRFDTEDNCRLLSNPIQLNSDGDSHGNVCDNCPLTDNENQLDTDGDCPAHLGPGTSCGDACDSCTDQDGDQYGDPGALNSDCLEDNCPTVYNPALTDTNGDLVVDTNDLQPDSDSDGYGDACDNCPALSNPAQLDSDFDGVGDGCDLEPNCPIGCEFIVDPSGGSPGGICDGCTRGLYGLGSIRDCLSFPPAPGFDSFLCLTASLRPIDDECPPWLAAVDACCPGGGLCPGPDVRLLAPGTFGEQIYPAENFGIDPSASGFGFTGRFIADRDGDDLPDLAIGVPGTAGGGQVSIVSSNGGQLLDEKFAVGSQDLFGFAVAAGKSGWAAGAPNGEAPFRGQGSPIGRVERFDSSDESIANLFGSVPGGEFGTSLLLVPDIDGDGIEEIWVGAPGKGDSGNSPGQVQLRNLSADPLQTLSGSVAGERFGAALDRCDLDGDGTEELIVGAPLAATAAGPGAGRVDVYDTTGSLVLSLMGAWAGGEFGSAVSCGPDVDGDQRPDLLIGAPLADASHVADAGVASLYSGSGRLLARYVGENAGDRLGRYVLLAPDLNGDGRGDVVVSAPIDDEDPAGRTGYFLSVADTDGDGFDNANDNCALAFNPTQKDGDADGIGDDCDNCPVVSNPGAIDRDGDGFGDACDCAPDDPSVYPGALEINDGQDNQCPGDAGYGTIDEYFAELRLDKSEGEVALTWNAQPGATAYQLSRSDDPRFLSGCDSSWPSTNTLHDTTESFAGQAIFYLVRPVLPAPLGWGFDAGGTPRSPQCEP